MSKTSQLSEIQQLILQMHQKPRVSGKAVDANSQINYNPSSRILYQQPAETFVRQESQTKTQQSVNTVSSQVNSCLGALEKIAQSKDQARGQFERQLMMNQTNIHNKIQAIKNQINYNKEKIDKLRKISYETYEEFNKFRDQQQVSIVDAKHYASKMEILQKILLNNSVDPIIEKPNNNRRSSSKNKKRVLQNYGQIIISEPPSTFISNKEN